MFKFPGAPPKAKRPIKVAVRKIVQQQQQPESSEPGLLEFVDDENKILKKIFRHLSAEDLKCCKLVSIAMIVLFDR